MCHGDDADSHRRRSFMVLTISSPLAPARSSYENRIMIYVIDTSRALEETFDTLDTWVVHSLCELQHGKFMTVDIHGVPFDRGFEGQVCGQYRGVLCALKGDQKYLQRSLKLTTSWNSENCCMYCGAKPFGDMLYTAYGPHAPHRQTMVNNDVFMTQRCRPNAWIRLPGFHIDTILTDWLHLVDLSYTPEVSASVTCMCTSWTFSPFGRGLICLYLQRGLPYINLGYTQSPSEALVELTEDSTIWEADSQDERLRLAYVQFSAECKRHRVSDLFARISVSAFGFTFPLDFIFSWLVPSCARKQRPNL